MAVPSIFLIQFNGSKIYLFIIVIIFFFDGCLVYYIVNQTIIIQGASIFISAVASDILIIILYICYFKIMPVNNVFDIVHATITKF